MSAADKANKAGFINGLKDVINISGESRQTLQNWEKNQPLRFDLILLGCKAKLEQAGKKPFKRPSWARARNGVSLSDRTVKCLIDGNYTGLDTIRKDMHNGCLKSLTLNNFGPNCLMELEQWIK